MALVDDTPVPPSFAAQRRSTSPEQRMNEFHSVRLTDPVTHRFGHRRSHDELTVTSEGAEPAEETALKVARAEAVEFVVKAFAAVDKNIALSDKARMQHEKNLEATDRMRLEAERELSTARQARQQAERELAEAHAVSEKVLSEARARSDRMVEAARERCEAEADTARKKLAETLAPFRDLVGQARAALDELVGSTTPAGPVGAVTIDIRDGAPVTNEVAATGLRVLATPVEAD